jgi:hypothetical protein
MSTIVVCIICLALIVVGSMTLSQGMLTSADTAALSSQQQSITEGEMMRTKLTGLSATLPAADTLQAVIENSGQTKLASFDKWDIIVQYYDAADNYYVNWLPYSTGTPGDNEWQKTGLYFNGQPEAFEPGILNPGEQLGLEAILDPAAGYRAIDLTVATPNGIAPTLVCGPPVLTAHTESVSPGGTDFYMLKGWTPADGTAATDTTDRLTTWQTGRWLLYNQAYPSRSAAHLFPLSGVNHISPSTWTVYYRGRADGWGYGSISNASLSIDIVIRQADGTIRDTLASDVAPAYFTGSYQWLNISGTFNFPGYDVVDDTDYLEIDFYGNSDNYGPYGYSYIWLRVDDGSLPPSSQTRIEGLAWF